jgi:hypothetical protein
MTIHQAVYLQTHSDSNRIKNAPIAHSWWPGLPALMVVGRGSIIYHSQSIEGALFPKYK